MRSFAGYALLATWLSAVIAFSLPVVDQPALSKRQAGTPEAPGTINTDIFPSSPINATAWALIYTYPLAVFSSWAGGVLRDHSVNEIVHQTDLASPSTPGVIKPNVDTLYSRAVLDLSQGDLVLRVPDIDDDRYWVFPIYDPFGNNLAEIGIVNDNQPGDYLIRLAQGATTVIGYSNDTSTFNSSVYRGVVNMPGIHGTMLIRMLLGQNTTENLEAVHRYQDDSKLTVIDRDPASQDFGTVPALTSLAVDGSLLGIDTPEKQLEFAARLVPFNPPQVLTEQRRVPQILSIAGLSGGKYTPAEDVDLVQAVNIANASITTDVNDPINVRDQGNGWRLSTPAYQGNFGTNYAAAAYVALNGYQQQSVRQTLYPGYRSLGFTSDFSLDDNAAVLVTFSAKPEVDGSKSGFWSLTVYGEDQYLISNQLNRYEVGDRTYNLTYGDGSHVYGPEADDSTDGSFDILIQPADLEPPANWTSNWLPAAKNFSWILRWYVPEAAMTNGSYTYPVVRNISAIVSN